MSAYRFGLSRLLDWRRRLEDDALNALLHAERIHERELARLETLQARHRTETEKLQSNVGHRMDVDQQSRDRNWLETLAQEILRQTQVVEHASVRCTTLRQQHKKARLEREVLEKLEERDRRKWKLESQRREQKAMDEVSAQRHLRKSREAS